MATTKSEYLRDHKKLASSKALILCVDDEPINLTIMEELLQDQFELFTTNSGDGCLQQVQAQKPDLILLDVNMPDMDGLETCQSLQADPESADIPIIFISALASHAELMAGYEAGGDDYITKPFSEEILRKKIDVVLASQRRKQELKKISDNAVEALMTNLSTAEELGIVVKFLSQIQAEGNLGELAKNVFDCLRELDLDSSLLIVAESENRIWFSDDIDRPLESQILESLRGQDRVVGFATRLAFNSDNATLLVRNLPTDEQRVQRLREYLTILFEGLDARIHGLQSAMLMEQRRALLARVLEAIRANLGKIDELHKASLSEILSNMKIALKDSMLEQNLTRQQEAAVIKILESTALETESCYGDGQKFDERFQGIIDELSNALNDSIENEKTGPIKSI